MPGTFSRSELHVAIIMDGNGRWALARGLPRVAGHQAGYEAMRRIVDAAPGLGIRYLTLYAFSSDNWKRPAEEVATVMNLLERYLREAVEDYGIKGIRLSVIGRRDRLPLRLCAAIEAAENATAGGERLHVRIAFDYSARGEILAAAARLGGMREPTVSSFARLLVGANPRLAEVDLLIRTGGEQRLSDFLLWECAYAELYFTPVMWPDFTPQELAAAIEEFGRRERRFGGLPVSTPSPNWVEVQG